ncbi:hypothetical protein FN846DRAFT_918623 [Sphaerosporella brunnea]|uniref:Uncharacterized protein n=1 Tax=Sphaerosporella brunnea TaxID=1250544 RepID=A0A5J5EZX8_9PEZI|nr:hypothetical protein FN846DRAFT_918623 [Sphaerosporella brunnea]
MIITISRPDPRHRRQVKPIKLQVRVPAVKESNKTPDHGIPQPAAATAAAAILLFLLSLHSLPIPETRGSLHKTRRKTAKEEEEEEEETPPRPLRRLLRPLQPLHAPAAAASFACSATRTRWGQLVHVLLRVRADAGAGVGYAAA